MANLNREGMDTGKYLLSDIQTRLAVVETQQNNSKLERAEIKAELRDVKETVHTTDGKVDSMREEFAKLKGTWGGIILAISSIIAFFSLAGDYILKWLKGLG